MKIAIISPYTLPQITQNVEHKTRPVSWTENLANALSRIDSIDVHVVAGISPRIKNIKYYYKINNIHFHLYKTSGRLSQYLLYTYEVFKVRRILKQINPHIVHGQGLESHTGMAAIFSGYPHVVTVHGILNDIFSVNYKDHFMGKILERFALKRLKNVIILNTYIQYVIEKYDSSGLRNKNYTFISNPVAPEFFKDKSYNLKDELKILYCGAFRPRKGLMDLLIALKELKNKNPDFILYITGIQGADKESDDFLKSVKSYVSINLHDNAKLLGFVQSQKMPELMRSMDLLVLPSMAETAPMVISEAMASGLPVIAYDAGGVKYMVEDEKTGFVVKKGDRIELAKKIRLFMEDKSLIIKFGKYSKRVAEKKYHPDLVATKTIEFYNEILNQKIKEYN